MPVIDQGPQPYLATCLSSPIAAPIGAPSLGQAMAMGNAPISGYRGDVSGLYTQMGHEASTPPLARVEQSTRDETSTPAYSHPPPPPPLVPPLPLHKGQCQAKWRPLEAAHPGPAI